MPIQYFDSPFHVTHNEEVASKMASEMEFSILIADGIQKPDVKEIEAAGRLNVTYSRVSELSTGKIE
jgi:predicted XRE-type DNA-binding protein